MFPSTSGTGRFSGKLLSSPASSYSQQLLKKETTKVRHQVRTQSRLAAKMALVVPLSLSAMSSKGGDLSDEIALLKDCLRPTQPAPRGRWLLGVPTPLGMEDVKAVEEGRQAATQGPLVQVSCAP